MSGNKEEDEKMKEEDTIALNDFDSSLSLL